MQIEVNRRLYMDEISRLPHDGFQALQKTFTLLAQHMAGSLPTTSRSGP